MTRFSREEARCKCDKALVLHEAGIGREAIAERLSVKPNNVHGMIQRAKERRAAAAGEVQE